MQGWRRGQLPPFLPAWLLSRPPWHHPVHSFVASPDATEDQQLSSEQETSCDGNTLDLLGYQKRRTGCHLFKKPCLMAVQLHSCLALSTASGSVRLSISVTSSRDPAFHIPGNLATLGTGRRNTGGFQTGQRIFPSPVHCTAQSFPEWTGVQPG